MSCRDATELQARLRSASGRIAAEFVRLDGLGLEPVSTHGAFQQFIRRLGLSNEESQRVPTITTLDWSRMTGCSAEGFAYFGVIEQVLSERGQHLLICAPAVRGLADRLDGLDLRQRCATSVWIGGVAAGRAHAASAIPALMFRSPPSGAQATPFLRAIDRVLDAHSVANEVVEWCDALVMELLQNIGTHAKHAWACAVAIVHTNKRPNVLEIGFADSGVGIPAQILSGPRMRWLAPLCDVSILESFVAHGTTSRAPEDGGGALQQVALGLLERVDGSALLIRSGSAFIRLDRKLVRLLRPKQLNSGFGTQIRIHVPL